MLPGLLVCARKFHAARIDRIGGRLQGASQYQWPAAAVTSPRISGQGPRAGPRTPRPGGTEIREGGPSWRAIVAHLGHCKRHDGACRRLPWPTSLLAAGLWLERFHLAYAEHREDACYWKMTLGRWKLAGCLGCLWGQFGCLSASCGGPVAGGAISSGTSEPAGQTPTRQVAGVALGMMQPNTRDGGFGAYMLGWMPGEPG